MTMKLRMLVVRMMLRQTLLLALSSRVDPMVVSNLFTCQAR